MLKTYYFKIHASAISGPFAEVLRERETMFFRSVLRSLEDVKNSGDITSRMRSKRISKTSPFSTSDLKLDNKRTKE